MRCIDRLLLFVMAALVWVSAAPLALAHPGPPHVHIYPTAGHTAVSVLYGVAMGLATWLLLRGRPRAVRYGSAGLVAALVGVIAMAM